MSILFKKLKLANWMGPYTIEMILQCSKVEFPLFSFTNTNIFCVGYFTCVIRNKVRSFVTLMFVFLTADNVLPKINGIESLFCKFFTRIKF